MSMYLVSLVLINGGTSTLTSMTFNSLVFK